MNNDVSIIKKSCFGCKSCEQICPTNSIFFEDNGEGFLYPVIKNTCIHCGLCLKKCPANKDNKVINPIQKNFYGFTANSDYKINSSSGGFATYLSIKVIENGGIVCGCALIDNFAKHIFVDNLDDLNKLQSSKYVQSDVDDIYKQVEYYLKNERQVLFIGTPCQVFGLQIFLGKDYSNLITVDLICHGVPSPKLFNYYIEYLKRKEKSNISEYNFRYKKKKGWGTYYYYYCDDTNKKRTGLLDLDKYGYDFKKSLNYRECCYECKFADIVSRPGDFSAGDFWGILKVNPSKYDGLGVSCIIVNSEKGKIFLDNNFDDCFFEVDCNDVLIGQGNLTHPTNRPQERDSYYNNFNEYFFDNKKNPRNISVRIKSLFPRFLKNFFKRRR